MVRIHSGVPTPFIFSAVDPEDIEWDYDVLPTEDVLDLIEALSTLLAPSNTVCPGGVEQPFNPIPHAERVLGARTRLRSGL